MGLLDAPLKTTQMYVMGSSLKAWIKQDTNYYTLATCDITNKLKKSSVIRVSGLMSYQLTGSIAGKILEFRINGINVHQVYPVATTKQFGFECYLYIGGGAQSTVRAQSFIGTGTAAIQDGTGNLFGANTSSLPTTTPITLTDTNDTFTIVTKLQGSGASGEFHTLEGLVVELLSTASPKSYNSNALSCWGDSLTAGTGGTAGFDYPSQLAKLRYGKPVYNGGIGGETAAQILTRILVNDIRGKVDTVVLWMGRNNVGSGTMQADVLSALASAVANLNHSRYVIMTVLNATTEANGSANKTALDALNAAIASTYSATNVLDIVATICTEPNGTPNPSWMSDTVHLNDTGYAAVASAVDAKLTANGW